MPPVDPRTVQPIPQTPMAQPWPGASSDPGFPTAGNPKVLADQGRADVRTSIDQHGDRRADTALGYEGGRYGQSVDDHNIKLRTIDARGGTDTQAEERQAAARAFIMTRALDHIKELQAKNPDALKPGLRETLGGLSSNAWLQDAAIPENIRSTRKRMNDLYREFTQMAVYSASGAAFNEVELQNAIRDLSPGYWDDADSLAQKRAMMEDRIGGAMLQAGATRPQIDAALAQFRESTKDIYSPKFGQATAPGEDPGLGQGANAVNRVPVPEKMQQEYAAAMAQFKPGQLTEAAYNAVVNDLYRKYGFTPGENNVKGLVDQFNKTGKFSPEIPATEQNLSGWQSGWNDAAQSAPGTFAMNFANAGAMGIPELLSGAEGRHLKSLADEKNPKSAIGGDIAGSLVPTMALEAGLARALARGGGRTAATTVGADILANAGYGAARGFNGAEDGSGLSGAAIGAGLGGVGALVGRGAVQGARGFTGERMTQAMDDVLKPQTFEVGGGRAPLPVDDATPAHFQSMSDDELRAELARAQQGSDAWAAHATQQEGSAAANGAALRLREQKLAPVIAANKAEQGRIAQARGINKFTPEQQHNFYQQMEDEYPTTAEGILRKNPDPSMSLSATDHPAPNLEAPDILSLRQQRLTDYLGSEPSAPQSITVPGVNATTMARAGLGEGEEFFQGLPGVHGKREAMMGDFNRQYAGRILGPLGEKLPEGIEPGQATNKYVNGVLNQRYEALKPSIKGTISPKFDNAVAALRNKVLQGGGPERQAAWGEIEAALQQFRRGAEEGSLRRDFDGTSYRELSSRLLDIATTLGKDGGDLADLDVSRAAEKIRGHLLDMVSEANPAAGRNLRELNSAWAKMKRVERASSSASALSQRGVYAPDDLLSAIKALDTSPDKGAIARGDGLDQPYVQNARDVLGGRPAKKASLKEAGIGFYAAGPALAVPALAHMVPGVRQATHAVVDGKVGQAADWLTSFLPETSPLRNLPSSVLEQLLSQSLAAYSRK